LPNWCASKLSGKTIPSFQYSLRRRVWKKAKGRANNLLPNNNANIAQLAVIVNYLFANRRRYLKRKKKKRPQSLSPNFAASSFMISILSESQGKTPHYSNDRSFPQLFRLLQKSNL
jgi:hypothetical protein